MTISKFIYTVLFQPAWIRKIINKVIIFLLPISTKVGKAVVILNPSDPVISGALTFGVYEKSEIFLMQRICQSGQTVIDIGANVGLYTAIAGLCVGHHGRVFSFEPEPESFYYLQKTVSANKLINTSIVQAAVASQNGKANLYTSAVNKGDHRLYLNHDSNNTIEVETIKLDDYLAKHNIYSADVIKMDIQGYEGHAILGMENLIRSSPQLIMFMEFWPMGLLSSGTDPLNLLNRLENMGLRIYEIKKHNRLIAIKNKHELIHHLPQHQYTNLLLLGKNAVLS